MARNSKRTEILGVALGIIEEHGLGGLTYESLATASGFTKGGLLYHFPSRDALIQALHEHMAGQWETAMQDAAGADPGTRQRWAAYARIATIGATRADLTLMLDAQSEDEIAPWKRVLDTWTPPVPTDPDDVDALRAFVSRLAADGLWLFEALDHGALTPQMRARVAEYIADGVNPAQP